MAFSSDRSFASLYDESFVSGVSSDIMEHIGGKLLEEVKRRTPIAQLPQAYKGDAAAWIEDRGGRKPGTLRERWESTGTVGESGSGLKVEVFNPDPVAIMVEESTRPHQIHAKMRVRADGGAYQGFLRYPMGPTFHFGVEVWHPGTQGQHMMRDTLAEIEATWAADAEDIIDLHATFYDET